MRLCYLLVPPPPTSGGEVAAVAMEVTQEGVPYQSVRPSSHFEGRAMGSESLT